MTPSRFDYNQMQVLAKGHHHCISQHAVLKQRTQVHAILHNFPFPSPCLYFSVKSAHAAPPTKDEDQHWDNEQPTFYFKDGMLHVRWELFSSTSPKLQLTTGLRLVKPYHTVLRAYAKRHWLSRPLLQVLCSSYSRFTPHYYVGFSSSLSLTHLHHHY